MHTLDFPIRVPVDVMEELGDSAVISGRMLWPRSRSSARRSRPPVLIFGSSRITGIRGFDFQEEEVRVAVPIGHPFHHFYPVVDPSSYG
jgi:hypothetical protein